ncbi:GntR family transcriptional regulator [Rhodothermus profundi]|uniref:Transcriptional regulator, GntR family n=1 Tax=Rhodothermus profundi TaxID=633813 RepID=A0A1M6QBN7_9BACT|nr:GntR family transcriptional regulator [Rhodothermus profundi]SHK17540.1 transcriptional regulator, GntR family [Rhodothermus profundi]
MLQPGRPRHQQLSDWLREQIEQGVYKPQDRLPSEHELSKRFGVSRITVRRALQTLEYEGLIYRCQGVGSFVRRPHIQQGLVRLTDFAEDMARAGLEARSKVVHFAPEDATAEVAARLEVPEGSTVVRLDRLRLGNGEPIAFDRTWLTPFYAQFLEGKDLERETIYGILEALDIPIVRGRYRIEAINATPEVARWLEVPSGMALLCIHRISCTTGGKVVYYQQRYYRSDRVVYELVLERDSRHRIPPAEGMPLREFEPVFQPPRKKS